MEFFKEANEPVITEGYDEPLTAQPVPLEELSKEELINIVKNMEKGMESYEKEAENAFENIKELQDMYNSDMKKARDLTIQLDQFHLNREHVLFQTIENIRFLMQPFEMKGEE